MGKGRQSQPSSTGDTPSTTNKQNIAKPSSKSTTEQIKQKVAHEVSNVQKNKKHQITNEIRKLNNSLNAIDAPMDLSEIDGENDTSTSSITIDEEKVFRFVGNNLNAFRNPIELANEINKNINFPKAIINKAFINNKNKNLYIITSDRNTIKHLQQHNWPKKSFISGISKALPGEKITYLAIRGVDTSIDIDEEQFKETMLNKYKLFDLKRLTKKSCNNKPLPILRAKCKETNYISVALSKGIQIGYTSFRVSLWKSDPKPLQCKNCNAYEHHENECFSSLKCPLCNDSHTLKECPNKEDQNLLKCSNCDGNHPAFSKKCPVMIEQTKKIACKQETFQKKNVQQFSNSNQNTKKNPQSYSQITQNPNNSTTIKKNNPTSHKNLTTDIKSILTTIITNLSKLISSTQLDMSSLVAINNVIANLIERINE